MEPPPVFLSDEERQRLALEHSQVAIADQHLSALYILQAPPPPPPSNAPRDDSSSHRYSSDRDRDRDLDRDGDTDRDRDLDRRRVDDSRRDRDQDRDRERGWDRERGDRGKDREKDLGSKKPRKKRVIKPSEKFSFSFDWDTGDVSADGIFALALH